MFWLESKRVISTAQHEDLQLRRSFGAYSLTTTDHTQLSGWFITGMWKRVLQKVRAHDVDVRRALVFGVALGDVLQLLLKNKKLERLVGVDYDSELFNLGKTIGVIPNDTRIEFVSGEAEQFINNSSENFSFVIVDLFSDHDPAPCVSDEKFQLAVRDHLSPNGIVAVNVYESTDVLEGWRKNFEQLEVIQYSRNTIGIYKRHHSATSPSDGART